MLCPPREPVTWSHLSIYVHVGISLLKKLRPSLFPKACPIHLCGCSLLPSTTGRVSPWSSLLCLLLLQRPHLCARMLLSPYWVPVTAKGMSLLCDLGHFSWTSFQSTWEHPRLKFLSPGHFLCYLCSQLTPGFPLLPFRATCSNSGPLRILLGWNSSTM